MDIKPVGPEFSQLSRAKKPPAESKKKGKEAKDPEPRDKAILQELGKDHSLYTVRTRKDSDKFGREIGAFEAKEHLDKNKPIIVKHRHIGNLRKAKYPEKSSDMLYTKDTPTDREKHDGYEEIIRHYTDNEGIMIESYEELERLNAACGLTGVDTTKSLSPEEKKAVKILRNYKGKIHGKVTVNVERWGQMGSLYYFSSRPGDGTDKGIYNPDKIDGGFLGIGGRPDRLSTYEAVNLLKEGKEIKLIDNHGKEYSISSFKELEKFHKK